MNISGFICGMNGEILTCKTSMDIEDENRADYDSTLLGR